MNKKLYSLLFTSIILGACNISNPEPTSTPVPTQIPDPTSTPTSTPTPEPTSTPTPAPWDLEGWNIVWHDEFDGSELSRDNWNFDIGGHGWGNREWQTYTDRPENVRVEEGMLVIEARIDPTLPSDRPYSSARIKTQGLHSWQYGRIEARMKLPYGQGIWPAFWMVGDINVTWPANGEIDILEFIGKEPDTIHATVHAPGYFGEGGVGRSLIVPTGTLKNDFHVYAIEWEEKELRWYFDDQEYFKLTPDDVPDEWIFNHPFYIILNLAVGGLWPGYPNETTDFPQFLLVDYVRVYQRP